jgi:hypothetical protein
MVLLPSHVGLPWIRIRILELWWDPCSAKQVYIPTRWVVYVVMDALVYPESLDICVLGLCTHLSSHCLLCCRLVVIILAWINLATCHCTSGLYLFELRYSTKICKPQVLLP